MSNRRGWVFEEEADVPEEGEGEEPDIQYEIRKQIVEQLVGRWNQLHNAIEHYHWQQQAMAEEGYSPYDDFDSDEEVAAYLRREQIRIGAMHAEKDEIESRLHSYGARMMRPYEHWNEDERYMEYMERDRDDDY
jgi:hypothetical protein